MSWSSVTKGSEAVKRIRLLTDTLGDPLAPLPSKWLDLDDILRFWARHTADFLQTESDGISPNDLLFLLLCHANVRLEQQKHSEPVPIQQLLEQVRYLGIPIPDCKQLPDAGTVFTQCAEALVVHETWTPDQAQSSGEKAKMLGFGLDLGTPDDIYEGEEMEQQQGEELKAELGENQQVSEMQARKRGRFLRWCSRTFLELWYVDRLLRPSVFSQQQQQQELQQVLAQWKPRFASWALRKCETEQPKAFAKYAEAWCTRLLTGLGAQRQKPKRDWAAAFIADDTGTRFVPKTLATTQAESVIKDETSPFSGLLRLALAVTHFDCLHPDDGFASQFLVLRDECLERHQWITATEVDRMLARRPVIVHLNNLEWAVHDNRRGWQGPFQGPVDALLAWSFLMQRDFEGQTVGGSRIDKWLASILGDGDKLK